MLDAGAEFRYSGFNWNFKEFGVLPTDVQVHFAAMVVKEMYSSKSDTEYTDWFFDELGRQILGRRLRAILRLLKFNTGIYGILHDCYKFINFACP